MSVALEVFGETSPTPRFDIESESTPCKVAIIIVGHDSQRWLRRLFDDLSSFGPQFTVVYVDNASNDQSLSFARSYDFIYTLSIGYNSGFGSACNEGARFAARFKPFALLFLNPDTSLDEQQVATLVDTLKIDDSVGAAGPLQVEYVSNCDQPMYNAWTRRSVLCESVEPENQSLIAPLGHQEFAEWLSYQGDELIDVRYANGAALAVRTSTFFAVNGFDPIFFLFFEEVDLCRRIRERGLRCVLVPTSVVHHAWGGHATLPRSRFWQRSKYVYMLTNTAEPVLLAVGKVAKHAIHDARSIGSVLAVADALLHAIRSAARLRRSRAQRLRAATGMGVSAEGIEINRPAALQHYDRPQVGRPS